MIYDFGPKKPKGFLYESKIKIVPPLPLLCTLKGTLAAALEIALTQAYTQTLAFIPCEIARSALQSVHTGLPISATGRDEPTLTDF